ncbi:class I SAM-dependent methyltransferase [Dactylosporangium sp. CS-033363]|uniref:class I SAM-dependent methyltransferase n=1 Tax=Dactylosporangium sp. CS-033363 TaxID=3239935 RepID=UPI003D8D2BE5
MQWTGRAAAFADSYAHLCGHTASELLDAAGVAAGVRLLDVGTGTGTVAALALQRGADVVAVDAEPTMVDMARSAVPDVRLGRLPELPFEDGSFDAVVANFVVNHVPDPGAAVADLARVSRGRVALTVWPYPAPPLQQLWFDIMAAVGLEPSPPLVAPELNFSRDVAGVTGLLEKAGLRDVSCVRLEWGHRTDLDTWWIGPANGMGALGEALEDAPPATVAAARREYERLASRYLDDDGALVLPTAAVLGSGVLG